MKSSNVGAKFLFCVEYSCKLILVASRPIVQGYTGHKNPHKILEYHSSFTKFVLFLDITFLENNPKSTSFLKEKSTSFLFYFPLHPTVQCQSLKAFRNAPEVFTKYQSIIFISNLIGNQYQN